MIIYYVLWIRHVANDFVRNFIHIDLIALVGYHTILRNSFHIYYEWNGFNQIINQEWTFFSRAPTFSIIINLFSDCCTHTHTHSPSLYLSLLPSLALAFNFLCLPYQKCFEFTSPTQRIITVIIIIIIIGHQQSMKSGNQDCVHLCCFVCVCNACVNGWLHENLEMRMVPEPCNGRE